MIGVVNMDLEEIRRILYQEDIKEKERLLESGLEGYIEEVERRSEKDYRDSLALLAKVIPNETYMCRCWEPPKE